MRAMWLGLCLTTACSGGFTPTDAVDSNDTSQTNSETDDDHSAAHDTEGDSSGGHTSGGQTSGGGTGDDSGGNSTGGGTSSGGTHTDPNVGSDGQVIILEVGSDNGLAWVSLFNAKNGPSVITNWKLLCYPDGDSANLLQVEIANASVASGDTYVLTNDASAFQSRFGFAANVASDKVCGDGNDPYSLQTDSGHGTDFWGAFGTNGAGTAWDYTGKAAHRNQSIRKGGLFSAADWTIGAAANAKPDER